MRADKTPYERDQDDKAAMILFMAWLFLLVWAWQRAFSSGVPVQTWHFWVVFFLLWAPLSYVVIELRKGAR